MSKTNTIEELPSTEIRPSFLEGLDLKLVLFGGKGGVGKTTSASATALFLAKQFPERAFLLASTDPAHSLKNSIAGYELPANLHFLEIDSRGSMAKFKAAHAVHLKEIALSGTFLDEKDVSTLLDLSVPGFDEVMAFNDIAGLLERNAYSCILVDTAPTGHTLRFLEMPQMMRLWLGALDAMLAKHRYMIRLYRHAYTPDKTDAFLTDMSKSIKNLATILADPIRCQFVPVVLAEAMSTKETMRLVTKLKEMKIAVTDILVNRLAPADSACAICSATYARQHRELIRISGHFKGHTLWGIPQQGGEVRGGERLSKFWIDVCPIQLGAQELLITAPPPLLVKHPLPIPEKDTCLLLFAGKGGVGKTTLASASAIRLAQEYPGKEVLLFSTDPAHSLADCFQTPIGPQEVRLGPGITGMEINPEAEFEKLKSLYASEAEAFFTSALKNSGIELEFDREVVQRIMDLSPPGLDEVMALLRAVELLETKKYDILVLDTAPTGHLIRLLEMPDLIQSWLKAIFGLFLKYKNVFRMPRFTEFLIGVSKKLKLLQSLLADPAKGQLYAVGILTEMARLQTQDLLAACRGAGVHISGLFLNLAASLGQCPLCSAVASEEAKVRVSFDETFPEIPRAVVYRCGEPLGFGRLAELGQALYER